ncbi:GNAT family acetyltransferase [Reinekea blandensis]|uniref:Acetyltransferase n=1 Tax=Reinekea blandensis MED297 TaxID=314283 RepID=A4BBV8_9GAMM|nr:GNAT family acetyltransferase [Reinekea blandensis]EAR10443.1 Acetyltransferase [Reinekea sp. MED297] [Reinekea blandensis MED297]
MLIRPFQKPDQPTVISLWHDCGLVVPWNNPEKDIDRKLREQPELFLVAEQDGVVVGTLMGGYEGHRGWMNYLGVRPDLQGEGIARQMITFLEQRLLERGCPKVNLQVRSTNTQVIEFYRQLGYSEDHAIGMGKRLIPDN